jgi:hypothetical protein
MLVRKTRTGLKRFPEIMLDYYQVGEKYFPCVVILPNMSCLPDGSLIVLWFTSYMAPMIYLLYA